MKQFMSKLIYANSNIMLMSTDLHECRDKTHDCDDKADCNNTIGSYKCKCKTGFHGDGKTCEGKSF